MDGNHVLRGGILAALITASSGFAQDNPFRVLPITGPLRRVAYDLSTGECMRPPKAERFQGMDVVFDNTCIDENGAYLGLSSAQTSGGSESVAIIDKGRIPDAVFPGDNLCSPGCRMDAYPIDRIEFAYCTSTGEPVDVNLAFWDPPLTECDNPILSQVPPAFSLSLANLPRSPAPGVQACYVISVTSSNGPLAPDARLLGSHHTPSGHFAYSFQMPGTTDNDGPILGGACAFLSPCPPCMGTIWERPTPTGQAGTGMTGGDSAFVLEGYGAPFTGCYFGECTSPQLGVYLELSSLDACPDIGLPFCDASDGAHDFCPCANPGLPDAGCDNAAGTGGARVDVTGLNIVAQTATITGTGFPPAAAPTALLIRAGYLLSSPVTFGDGVRCVGTNGLVRLAATTASDGSSAHAFSHGAGSGSFHYQIWYRSNPASYCTSSAFNLSSGCSINW